MIDNLFHSQALQFILLRMAFIIACTLLAAILDAIVCPLFSSERPVPQHPGRRRFRLVLLIQKHNVMLHPNNVVFPQTMSFFPTKTVGGCIFSSIWCVVETAMLQKEVPTYEKTLISQGFFVSQI